MHLVLQPNDHALVACNIMSALNQTRTQANSPPNHSLWITSTFRFLILLVYNFIQLVGAEGGRGKLPSNPNI